MPKEWLNSYIDFLYKGQPNQALAHKTENMNSIIYRFERFEECRLNTLENSKIYLSNPTSFNDVFDTKGIYYTKDFLKSFQEKHAERLPSFDKFEVEFEKILNTYYNHCGIACFTEELYNFPMWWSYADNRSGFCVEYDFSENKESKDKLLLDMHPVLYTAEKFNFENLLRPLLEQIFKENRKTIPAMIIFHYLLGTIKHISWSYEKEWRYIGLLKQGISDFPVKVKAIYLGDNFSKSNYPRMIEISNKLNCTLYQMTLPKYTDKSYSFIPVKIEE